MYLIPACLVRCLYPIPSCSPWASEFSAAALTIGALQCQDGIPKPPAAFFGPDEWDFVTD